MKLKIGGITYDVVKCDMPGDDVSEIELNTNTIRVSNGFPSNQEHAAILHEVIHAINWKISENEVEYMAQALYSFIISNPSFIRDIISSLPRTDHPRSPKRPR